MAVPAVCYTTLRKHASALPMSKPGMKERGLTRAGALSGPAAAIHNELLAWIFAPAGPQPSSSTRVPWCHTHHCTLASRWVDLGSRLCLEGCSGGEYISSPCVVTITNSA